VRAIPIGPLPSHPTVREVAYRRLRQLIVNGTLAPLERIFENGLAEELGADSHAAGGYRRDREYPEHRSPGPPASARATSPKHSGAPRSPPATRSASSPPTN